MALVDEISALPAPLLKRLHDRGFRAERLAALAKDVGTGREARNRLTGEVGPPRAGDILELPPLGAPEREVLRSRGLEALRRGEVALCVLAGGMATRMGGVVKALVEALPGKTFLDLRLAEQAAHQRLLGAEVPLWLMTSEATYGPIVEALGDRVDGERLAVFEQCVSVRITPEGSLFREADGDPSVYATGHGDLPEALQNSGLLARFLEKTGGRGTVWIANLDNLGATVDPVLLGLHLEHGGPLTVEVVDKVGSDKGGVPVVWNGRRIIAEEFRLPQGLDPSTIRVFNTNTFLADAAALRDLDFEFTFVEVEKSVDGKKAVQFERLLGEVSVPLEPRFVRVPRDGAASRFLPVKDVPELEKRRPEIQAVAEERGFAS
jgi:UTP--glucose-1-phosphate uridylyltransferase